MGLFKFLYDFFWGPDDEEPYRPKVNNRRQANSGYRHTSRSYRQSGSSYRQSGQSGFYYGSPDACRGTERECLTEYYGDEDPDCGFHSYSGAYFEGDDGDGGGGSFFGGGGEEG